MTGVPFTAQDELLAKIRDLTDRDIDLAVALRKGWHWKNVPAFPAPMLFPPGVEEGAGHVVPSWASEMDAAKELQDEIVAKWGGVAFVVTKANVHATAGPFTLNETTQPRAVCALWVLKHESEAAVLAEAAEV